MPYSNEKDTYLLLLVAFTLAGYRQKVAYKEISRFETVWGDRVVVLQIVKGWPPSYYELLEEAQKYSGAPNLTVVFYPSPTMLPNDRYLINTSYSEAKKMAINEHYFAVYTNDRGKPVTLDRYPITSRRRVIKKSLKGFYSLFGDLFMYLYVSSSAGVILTI